MAVLLPPDARVLDASGVAVNGGQVRVYLANTTTPASLYSDAALTVPLSNPVVCNSAGYPSTNGTAGTLIFAAAVNYDVAFLTSVAAGSSLLRSWEDVPGLGSDAATLTRDFTNSRFSVRGSGGTIYIEAGDASPDNVGGLMRLGGWNGTEADLITLDGAVVNVDGRLTEGGKKVAGIVATAATTFTAVSNVVIELVNTPAGVKGWDIDVFDIVTSSAGTVNWTAHFSYDGAGTFKTGASDYFWMNMVLGAAVVLANPNGAATADTAIAIGSSRLATADRLSRISSTIFTPDSGTAYSSMETRFVTFEVSASAPALILSTGFGAGGYGRATHVRFTINTGTMTGKYRTVPRRGTGDA